MEHFENQNMKKNIKSWVEQGLSVKAQALLLTLIVLPKQNGTVWETQAEMASFMGVTPLTVSRGMKELIKANLVEVAERGSYRVKENVGFKGAQIISCEHVLLYLIAMPRVPTDRGTKLLISTLQV